MLYSTYVWLPRQANNGYIDILNELGIIGSMLFAFVLINYFVNLTRLKQEHLWRWFVFAMIIINVTESSILRPRSVTSVMFIFSYFALFTDLLKSEKSEFL